MTNIIPDKFLQINAFIPNLKEQDTLKINLREFKGPLKVSLSGFGRFSKQLKNSLDLIFFLSGHELPQKEFQFSLEKKPFNLTKEQINSLQLPIFLLLLESLGILNAGMDLASMSASGVVLLDENISISDLKKLSNNERARVLDEYLYGFGFKEKINTTLQ